MHVSAEEETWTGKAYRHSEGIFGPGTSKYWAGAFAVLFIAHMIGALDTLEFHPENAEHLRGWWDAAPGFLEHAGLIVVGAGGIYALIRKKAD